MKKSKEMVKTKTFFGKIMGKIWFYHGNISFISLFSSKSNILESTKKYMA